MKFDTSWSTCPCEERLRKLGLFILGRDSFSPGAYKEVVEQMEPVLHGRRMGDNRKS